MSACVCVYIYQTLNKTLPDGHETSGVLLIFGLEDVIFSELFGIGLRSFEFVKKNTIHEPP